MARTVDSIAWLDTPLWVDRALAGVTYRITLGSGRARLTLPLENVADEIHSMSRRTPPAPRFPGKRRPAPLRAARAETGFALPVPEGMLVVSAVRLRIAAEGDLAIGSYTTWPITQVGALFGAWLVRAEAWLDIWTGTIRAPVTRVGMPLVRAALPNDDGGLAGVGTGGPVPVVIRGQRSATAEEVAASFAAASAELDIPLAYAILRRSLVELHAGEHRLCVIDACSAAEVALDAALTAYLHAHGLTSAETERLLRLGSGIAEAFPVYKQLVGAGESAVSRNRVIDQLANPRQPGRSCRGSARRNRRRACTRNLRTVGGRGGSAAASRRYPTACASYRSSSPNSALGYTGGTHVPIVGRGPQRAAALTEASCRQGTLNQAAAPGLLLQQAPIADADVWSRHSRLWLRFGGRMGGGDRRETASVDGQWRTNAAKHTAFPQFRGHLNRSGSGAPSRIRTCAHGSGGRCSIP
jgi:hypothetical protein